MVSEYQGVLLMNLDQIWCKRDQRAQKYAEIEFRLLLSIPTQLVLEFGGMTSPIAASFMRLPPSATASTPTSLLQQPVTPASSKKGKDNSKAERRAAQRGAAAATTATASTPSSSTAVSARPALGATASVNVGAGVKVSPIESTLPTSVEQVNPLQLFLHLDLPASSSALSHSSKASTSNIHPSIIILALQYAEFKIVGANARCIAMLEAFKDVSWTSHRVTVWKRELIYSLCINRSYHPILLLPKPISLDIYPRISHHKLPI